MAYLAGNFTSVVNLIDTIRSFLNDNGWTIDAYADSLNDPEGGSQATGKELHVHKDDMYFHLKTYNGCVPFYRTNSTYATYGIGLAVTGSTGYDALKTDDEWDQQTGYPVSEASSPNGTGCVIELGTDTTYPYYMFLSDDCFTLAVEKSTGVYKFMTFGTLNKIGSYTGGQFFASSDSSGNSRGIDMFTFRTSLSRTSSYYYYGYNAAVYVVDGPNGTGWYVNGIKKIGIGVSNHSVQYCEFQGVCSNIDDRTSVPYNESLAYPFVRGAGYNTMTARRPMLPIMVTVAIESDTSYSDYSRHNILGSIPQLRAVDHQALNLGDELIYGTDTWKVFPNHKLGDVSGENIDNCGIAISKE